MSKAYEKYYVPEQSPWPIVGAVALFMIAFGAGNFVNEVTKKCWLAGFVMSLMNLCMVCIANKWTDHSGKA